MSIRSRLARRRIAVVVGTGLVWTGSAICWWIGDMTGLLVATLVTLTASTAIAVHVLTRVEATLKTLSRSAHSDLRTTPSHAPDVLSAAARHLASIDAKLERPSAHAEQLLRAVNAAHTRLELSVRDQLNEFQRYLEACVRHEGSEAVRDSTVRLAPGATQQDGSDR